MSAAPNVFVGDVPIKRVRETKALGVCILMNICYGINILIKLLKRFHPELERSESSNLVAVL